MLVHSNRPKALNLAKAPSPLGNTREDLEFHELSEKYMENMKKGSLSPENTKNEEQRTKNIQGYRSAKLAQLKASGNLFLKNSEGSEKYGPYPLDPRLNKLQKRAEEEVARRNELPIPNRSYLNYGVDISPPAGAGGSSPPAGAGGSSPPAVGVNVSPRKRKTRRSKKILRKTRRNKRS